VSVVGLMIDPRDLGRSLGGKSDPDAPPSKGGPGDAAIFDPTIFLYDQVPGGVGLSARLFDERAALLRRALALVSACGCEDGCPACIGPAMIAPSQALAPLPIERRALVRSILEDLGVEPVH